MLVKGEDGKMVECEIISTRDHESVFNKNAPILPLVFSVLCCILNIVPGKNSTNEIQCGNFRIFLSLIFYVKSKLVMFEVQKLPFHTMRGSEFSFS